jgi:hypothetical protein
VGALNIVPRIPIGLEATAGDDDPFKEKAEAGIQVSEDLFHQGGIIDTILDNPMAIRSRLPRRRRKRVSTSQERFRKERGNKKAIEVLRSGRRVISHSALLTLSVPSVWGFLAG